MRESAEAGKLVARLVQAQLGALKERRKSFYVVLGAKPSDTVMAAVRNAFPEPEWIINLEGQKDRSGQDDILLTISLASPQNPPQLNSRCACFPVLGPFHLGPFIQDEKVLTKGPPKILRVSFRSIALSQQNLQH